MKSKIHILMIAQHALVHTAPIPSMVHLTIPIAGQVMIGAMMMTLLVTLLMKSTTVIMTVDGVPCSITLMDSDPAHSLMKDLQKTQGMIGITVMIISIMVQAHIPLITITTRINLQATPSLQMMRASSH